VTVLEASPCVGGRARQAQLPSGTSVELGATWFHGVRDNPVYDLAVWLGVAKDLRHDPEVQKHDIDWQLHFARPMESQLLQGELNNVAMEAVGRYTEVAEECTQGAQTNDGSVGDVLRRTYDQTVEAEQLSGPALQTFAEAWHFREQLQRTFDGFYSTDDVGLAFAREYETLDGPNLPVPGGYQTLLERLAQGLDVRCNHAVTRISYGPGGACVTCANGAVIEADAVLVTLSLGVLQAQHDTLFDPPLPAWKQEAMSGLRIGVADKVFVEFEIEPAHALDAAMWLTSHTNSVPSGQRSSSTGEFASVGPSSGHQLSVMSGGLPTAQASPSPQHPAVAPASPSPVPGAPNTPSPPHLPPGVASALPPQATGGQPEPFNIGRKPAPHSNSPHLAEGNSSNTGLNHGSAPLVPLSEDSEMSTVTRQAAGPSTLSASHAVVSGPPPTAPSVGGRRRRKHKRTIHSYAFLWPVADPMSLGLRGAQRGVYPGVVPNPLQLPTPLAAVGIPSWCLGLHSIRYCPGPEWIHPALALPGRESTTSDASGATAAGGSLGKRPASEAERPTPSVSATCGGATHISGVLWITGDAAVAMERASDEEVAAGVSALFKAFPQVPLPPGAKMPPRVVRTKWGTDPLFRGSYSYTRVGDEGGNAVDMLAEPLCTEDGMPIVLFAGEATHRSYIGTVHGAFLSGCREAERLLMVWQEQQAALAAHALPAGTFLLDPTTHLPAAASPGQLCAMEHAAVHSSAWDPTMTLPLASPEGVHGMPAASAPVVSHF